MSLNILQHEVMAGTPFLPKAHLAVIAERLEEGARREVLAFLAERPVHTVIMAGLIRDNGLVSPRNRGAFWGICNSSGRLEGVALIGHHTLVEARTRRAVREFALAAQADSKLHMILGEADTVEQFWDAYADEGQRMRLACRELLFESREGVTACEGAVGLRLATPDDLNLIVPVHAGLAEAESGVNPLEVDPEGFRRRCLRRIEQGCTWVMVSGRRLLFKADLQADTPEVVYLEGVYVHPAERGSGLGRRRLRQLTARLLARAERVCLLANEENERAHAFYRTCEYRLGGVYDTIFLGRHGE